MNLQQARKIRHKRNSAHREMKCKRMRFRWKRQHINSKLCLMRLKRDGYTAYESAFESWSKVASENWFNYEYILDDFAARMESVGIEVDASDVHFSGFYLQGDGASFRASVPLDEKYVAAHELEGEWEYVVLAALHAENITNPIEIVANDSRYTHQYTMQTDSDDFFDSINPELWVNEDDIIDSGMYKGMLVETACNILQNKREVDTLADDVLDTCRDYASELFDTLRNDYEWATSHECFDDYLVEYGFTYDRENEEVDIG